MWQRQEIQEVLRRSARTIVPAIIVVFWLVMMGVLIQREWSVRRGASGLASRTSRGPTESWMGIFVGDTKRIGYMHVQEAPEVRLGVGGLHTRLTAEVAMTFLGVTTKVVLSGHLWRAIEGGLAEFDFRAVAGKQNFRVEGGIKDKLLAANVYTGGEAFPLSFPVHDDVLFTGGLGSTIDIPLLDVGSEYEFDAFDPMTFSMGKTRVKCVSEETIVVAGETHKAKVVTMTSSGVSSKAWISETGEVLKAQTGAGFILSKITPQEALSDSVAASDGILERVAIVPTGKLPIRGARTMTFRPSGFEFESTFPTDGAQLGNTDGTLTTTQAAPPQPPYTPELPEDERQAALAADPLVQSNHPKIVERARSVIGAETDTWKQVELLYQHIFTTLEKVPVWSVPSALDVLESNEGDCNEHTVLFAALARSVGIPTRIAIGVVWSDEYHGFYYHAWPEVYVGRWVWVDPTLGQLIADATHIKLVSGGIEKWPQLYPYLGQLQIEVIDIQ